MNEPSDINQQKTALLVMDMQPAILKNLPAGTLIRSQVAGAITAAREKKISVIYVRVGFRKGMPELNTNNKIFQANSERFANISMDEFLQIDPSVEPHPSDIIVTKRRISAFTGSDLEVVLRAQNIQHLVLSGVSTSGVVLSTTREAADKDYRITILSDCCADADEEVHRILTTKIFPRQTAVVSLTQWKNS